jgi:hypothetical protein
LKTEAQPYIDRIHRWCNHTVLYNGALFQPKRLKPIWLD